MTRWAELTYESKEGDYEYTHGRDEGFAEAARTYLRQKHIDVFCFV